MLVDIKTTMYDNYLTKSFKIGCAKDDLINFYSNISGFLLVPCSQYRYRFWLTIFYPLSISYLLSVPRSNYIKNKLLSILYLAFLIYVNIHNLEMLEGDKGINYRAMLLSSRKAVSICPEHLTSDQRSAPPYYRIEKVFYPRILNYTQQSTLNEVMGTTEFKGDSYTSLLLYYI